MKAVFCMGMILLLVSSVFCYSYVFELEKEDEQLSLLNVYIVNGDAPDRKIQPNVGHEFRLISDKDEVIYNFRFSTSTERYYAPPPDFFDETGKQVKFNDDKTNFETEDAWFDALIVPYYDNAIKAEIYSPQGDLVLVVGLEKYYKPGDKDRAVCVPWLLGFVGLAAVGRKYLS